MKKKKKNHFGRVMERLHRLFLPSTANPTPFRFSYLLPTRGRVGVGVVVQHASPTSPTSSMILKQLGESGLVRIIYLSLAFDSFWILIVSLPLLFHFHLPLSILITDMTK